MALVSVIANIVAGVCFFIWIALYISHCIIKAVFEERDERQIGGIATIKNHKIAIILLKKY
ncbi:MAG: hypothetical protein FWF58_03410, partial [Firmicutes bacterium]|nr:hypothetical protein [Bacillota bacterium]